MSKIPGMIGRKIGMTHVYTEDGEQVATTVLEVGPCTVLQKKTKEREGYNALQLGFAPKPQRRLKRPEWGHVKKAGVEHGFYCIKEIRVPDPDAFEVGQVLTLADLDVRSLVDITGTSKGRGFSGTIKRHGFHKGPMGHGSKHHRQMGSIGQCAWPSKIIKGKKMPGRFGGARTTVKNSMVVDVRPEDNLLLVKGSVPGAVNQYVILRCK